MNHDLYMMGIGGIGMSNVAVLLSQAGFRVSGSDENIYEPAAGILRTAGIATYSPYSEQNLPKSGVPVIVGNAQSRGHEEVEAALARNLTLHSFPEFIARNVLANRHRIVVAGTHGKSTTTACLAHVLETLQLEPGYLIGAQPVNFVSGGACGSGEHFVIEGDEYDSAFFDKRSKFLHYFPRTLILGPVEYDHADIFPDIDSILLSFRRLIQQLPNNGALIYDASSHFTADLAKAAPCPTISVGGHESDFHLLDSPTTLRFETPDKIEHEFAFSIPGRHNRMNALMSIAAVTSIGHSVESCRAGIETFRGNRRRMERLYAQNGRIVYDDFAHHPTAIAAALQAVRETHPAHRIVAVIEPRSNTMVRNIFQKELPVALAAADCVVVGDIHRLEKIPPQERLDFSQIERELNANGTSMQHSATSEIPESLQHMLTDEPTVILFMSNGSFGDAPRKFVDLLNH